MIKFVLDYSNSHNYDIGLYSDLLIVDILRVRDKDILQLLLDNIQIRLIPAQNRFSYATRGNIITLINKAGNISYEYSMELLEILKRDGIMLYNEILLNQI